MRDDLRTNLPANVKTQTREIIRPFTDLNTATGIGTQALFGQRFEVITSENGISKGALLSVVPNASRIDYIGTIETSALAKETHDPTHIVSAVSAAVFKASDIKSKLLGCLPRNAALAGGEEGDFLNVPHVGFLHLRHLRRANEVPSRAFHDVAKDMLELPYIWGGTGGTGVDCSGLVQSALAALGRAAPRDADQQEDALGCVVDFDDRQAGDLIFWPGHVGIVIEGDDLLHANAFHMKVAIEPVKTATTRTGAPRSVKRLALY